MGAKRAPQRGRAEREARQRERVGGRLGDGRDRAEDGHIRVVAAGVVLRETEGAAAAGGASVGRNRADLLQAEAEVAREILKAVMPDRSMMEFKYALPEGWVKVWIALV